MALAGEGMLVVIALVWAGVRGLPLALGPWPAGLAVGAAAAVGFVLVNGWLLCGAPSIPVVTAIRRVYALVLGPLFARVGVVEVVGISVAAGVGEELLFRGVMQPELGLVPASVIFGALHLGGSGTLAFGCWAAVMGTALGGLAIWSGGLLAPIVAHALYDAAAIAYVRWGRDCPAVAGLRLPESDHDG